MLDDLKILWPSKLGRQGTAPLLDNFCEVQVRLAIPIAFLSAPTQDNSSSLTPRKDVRCFTIAMRGAEVHLTDWGFRALDQDNLALSQSR